MSASDANTRIFTVTGGAAESYLNKGTKTRRRKNRTTGGASTVLSPNVTMPVSVSVPAPIAIPPPTIKVPDVVKGGAVKPVKVILGPKAKVTTKVVLEPAKAKKTVATKTRKIAKKIRMSLEGFGKRVTRANHIRQEAKKQSLDEIKKTLVESKLIKETSKAPEGVLREMYSNYMMLKRRAL